MTTMKKPLVGFWRTIDMYINILHLLWIVPLSTMVGVFFVALVTANGRDGDE